MSQDENEPQNDPPWAEGVTRPPPWTDAGGRTVYENPWLRLTEHNATAPTGAPALYAVLRPRNLAVGVLPIHDDGTVTLVGQSRFACADFSWEMPEGGAPFDEDPLEGIRRELAEEAGLKADHWLEVLQMQMSNSVTDERAVAWLCWGLSPAPVAPDPTEVIVTARTPFMTLIDAIGRGQVQDAFTVATALRAYHMARESLLPGWLAHVMLHRL
ncbi:MAG TPA: NUDIX hydrolase [Brevundimonas sp.]|uniref:NUDIX domain-containing protein n=1 Tax=Brevundimonas sp. TaxID=1871086 RepID=UPI002627E746|nr:NUDIX hydrolase [Brevundimonas sp.]HRO33486.1 NUDIX hydrolase [Brevundimonas sp.]